jgi:hypothetical protein
MKYSEVIHTNKEFDEKAGGGGSSAMRRGATDNTGQRVIRDERGTRYARHHYLRKIGCAWWISRR